MAAMLIEIKSRMLLPRRDENKEEENATRAPNWCDACWNTNR